MSAASTRPASVVLIANPGSGRAHRFLPKAERLIQAAGLTIVDRVQIEHLDRLQRWVQKPAGERPLFVAAGGDGTVGAVAGILVDTDAVLGILPVGTSNDIARSIGLPMRLEDAVRLLRDGEVETVDVGRYAAPDQAPRYFLHAATIGINVAFAHLATQSSFRHRLGPFTYLVAGVVALRDVKPFDCELRVGSRTLPVHLLQLSIINAPVFGGLLNLEVPGSKIDDRRLDALAIENIPLHRLILAAVHALIGRRGPRHGFRVHHVSKLSVHTLQPLEVSFDGEIAATTPGDFSISAEALNVLRPRRPASSA